jgi:alpha-mannosidase
VKRGNRICERRLFEAELLDAHVGAHGGQEYGQGLDDLWERVLTYQAHDVLAGTSIDWVNRDARAAHQYVIETAESIISDCLGVISRADAAAPTAFYSTSPFARHEVCLLDGEMGAVLADGGKAHQHLADGRVAAIVKSEALGYGAADAVLAWPPVTCSVSSSSLILSNGRISVTIGRNGRLHSLLDMASAREVFSPGCPGNVLRLYEDYPNGWDAWDVERHLGRSRREFQVESVTVDDNGPLLCAVRVVSRCEDSLVDQRFVVTAGSSRLDVETVIAWQARDVMLKVEFPVDVAGDWESSEVQFGHVRRPVTDNTGWDHERFETFSHRWILVGETDYGVAVVKEQTFGQDVVRARSSEGRSYVRLQLSLLRSTSHPDPNAEHGVHRFVYGIVPGASLLDATKHGAHLSSRLLPVRAESAWRPLVQSTSEAVVVSAIKRAADGSGDVVVRLYEAIGSRARSTIRFGFSVSLVSVVNHLEEHASALAASAGAVDIELRPFEVVTLRCVRN